MADAILTQNKPCIKCGSTDRDINKNCRPCQLLCATRWKIKHRQIILNSGEPVFYTYAHIRKDANEVFYIGKGSFDRAYQKTNRNNHWHKIVAKHGFKIKIINRWHDEKDSLADEVKLIAEYKAKGISLCNYTIGGDGISGHKHSAETRAKISAIQLGKKLTAEHKAKVGAAGKGRIVSEETRRKIGLKNAGRKYTEEQNKANSERNKGKKLSQEHINAIIKANTGSKRSQESKDKISKALTGKLKSVETRLKISLANKGIKRSEEFKKNLSLLLTGRPCSEETKLKISLSNKKRFIK